MTAPNLGRRGGCTVPLGLILAIIVSWLALVLKVLP